MVSTGVNQLLAFPNMADLEPLQYMGQQRVQNFNRHPSWRLEYPDASFPAFQAASAYRDEEPSREQVAPAVDETEKQNIDKTDTSRFPVQAQETEKQNIDKTDTSRFPVQAQETEKQNIDKTDTSQMPVQAQETEKQNIDKTDTSQMPVQAHETEKQNVNKTDASDAPVQAQDMEKQLHLDKTSRIPVQVKQMKQPPSSFGNYLNPAKYIVAKRIGHGGFAKVLY